MLRHVIWINEDIIKIFNYVDIEKVQENIVHELLESCKGILWFIPSGIYNRGQSLYKCVSSRVNQGD